MASGWAPDSAVQDQIDATVMDAVLAARSQLPSGEGSIDCGVCGEHIPWRRRQAIPGVRTCVACQSERDKRPILTSINRCGSKAWDRGHLEHRTLNRMHTREARICSN